MKQRLVAPDTLHGVSTPPPTPGPAFPTPDKNTDELHQHDREAVGDHDHRDDGEHDHDDRDLVDITAVEVVSRAAVMLMSAAAEQLGLSADDPDDPEHRDLDEARTLITALAGLLQASLPDLGAHAAAFREGLSALQGAFRDYSIVPDEPGKGPGENLGRRTVH